MKKAIDNPKEFNNYKTSDDDIWALSRLYPVTYHLGCKDLFLQRFKTMDKKIDIAFIDFRTIRHQLTEKQKTLLWDLLDFDYNKYNHLLSSKKYLLLLGGFFFGNQNLRLALHQFADNLQKGILIDLPKDLIWVYKPHPSYSSKEDLEYMQDLKEKWEFIPAQIPVETFILAGLEPTYIAGYPSSANYSFTNDQTTLLLERSNYQKVLKELGITDNKFISLQKLETQKGL